MLMPFHDLKGEVWLQASKSSGFDIPAHGADGENANEDGLK
jgi:hypothetical protein